MLEFDGKGKELTICIYKVQFESYGLEYNHLYVSEKDLTAKELHELTLEALNAVWKQFGHINFEALEMEMESRGLNEFEPMEISVDLGKVGK